MVIDLIKQIFFKNKILWCTIFKFSLNIIIIRIVYSHKTVNPFNVKKTINKDILIKMLSDIIMLIEPLT